MAIICIYGHLGLNITVNFKHVNYTSKVHYKVNLAINKITYSNFIDRASLLKRTHPF